VPAATLFGNWLENGKLKRGNFDIVMDTWGADFDPDPFLSTLFKSDQIPTAANNGEGWNFFRLRDAQLDRHIALGSSTLNIQARKAHYREAVKRILDSIVYIPLYNRAVLDAFRTRVRGERGNAWDEFTWNAKDWWISR
jgi:peptide/nickel transport system substrate-binding protein